MSRWTTSNPHPTKINLFIREGVWVAKHGDKEATAPFRVQFAGPGKGCVDFGKFDALHRLCTDQPALWDAGYVVLDSTETGRRSNPVNVSPLK